MQKVQAHDDETLGSGSSIAELDNETDTFGREIMQHERDARRIQNATRGGPQPLLKPRARPRISELVARREREEAAASGQQQHIRAGSTGSNDSNPPLNVPREWGTRAKSHRGWMRKIREPSIGDTDVPGHVADKGLLTPEEDADVKPRTLYGSDNIWNREDEQAISMENTPPSMKRARPNVQQTKIRDANSTLRHIIDSEDHEFSELSLLTSTPATTKAVRNYPLRDDIEGAERRATVNRGQNYLSERSPNRNTTHGRQRDNALDAADRRTVPKREDTSQPATTSYAEARTARRSALIGNKENLPAGDVRDDYSKNNENITIADRTARAVTFRQQQRSSRAGNGSLHLLQRLATSLSPNSGKSSSDALQSSGNDVVHKENVNAAHRRTSYHAHEEPVQPTLRRARRTTSTGPSDEPDRRTQPSRTESDALKPEGKARLDETPAPIEKRLDDRTPVVTGAWVDTPGPVGGARPPPTNSQTAPLIKSGTSSQELAVQDKGAQHADRTPYGDPNRPRSVLEEIVRDARKDPASAFGDATIQSLEDIVHPNTDPTDTTVTFDAAENLDIGRPLTQAEKDRRQEDLAIEAMNKHLRAARTSIKDADRGLQRVENKWEETSQIEVPRISTTPAQKANQVVMLDRDRGTACDHCGGSYWQGLWTELRSIFYVYDKSARYGFRVTWPGILVLTWLLWNILENLLCYYYCHPLYAEFMTGFGVNPDAPRYPFVIPTLLFRPLRPIWRPAFAWLEACCTTALYTVFGEPVRPRHKLTAPVQEWGYPSARRHAEQVWTSTWTGRAATTAVAAARRATRSFVDAVDAFGGETMNDDEYL